MSHFTFRFEASAKIRGGRLLVDRHPDRNDVNGNRSEWIKRFADFCKEQGAVDGRGLVTRKSVETSSRRRVIAKKYNKMLFQRGVTASQPEPEDMIPIDSSAGEVIIFNNKRFHDVEPWKLDVHRAIYIVRCFPLYDLGLSPPSTFLNNVACNRFTIDSRRGTLNPTDIEKELPQFFPLPN